MDAVDEIKSRLAIDDVVGRYVELKRSGASYKGLCPFHQERSPSFYVTPARGTYHCFGCGKGGDVFNFVMEAEHLQFPEALTRLAQESGVALPERDPQKPSLKNRLYEANEAAVRFFGETLRSESGRPGREYLKQRYFGADAVLAFDLGFAPTGRDAMTRYLQAAGFEDRILVAAGLVLQDERTGALRDRFHDRLMFPIRDASGKVSGFGARTLGDAQPKYLNSPQTEIFDKSSVLFGVHRSRDAIRQAGKAVLVEGYLDAVRAHVGGFANVVASLGTAVTVQQLTSLSRMTDTVILALDPDAAGQSAATRTSLDAYAAVLGARGRVVGGSGALDLRIATLPAEHGDPDEMIRDHPELWQGTIDAAIPALDFFFNQTLHQADRTSDGWRQQVIERLMPLMRQFGGSADLQPRWIERLSRETGLDPRSLQRMMFSQAPAASSRRAPRRSRPNPAGAEQGRQVVEHTTSTAVTQDPAARAEEKLVALILKLVVLPSEAATLLEGWKFNSSDYQAIVEAALQWAEHQNYDYDLFRETLPEGALRERADALRALDEPIPDDGKLSLTVAYYLARLRLLRIEAQVRRSTDVLKDAAADDHVQAVAGLGQLMDERRETEEALARLSALALQSGSGLVL